MWLLPLPICWNPPPLATDNFQLPNSVVLLSFSNFLLSFGHLTRLVTLSSMKFFTCTGTDYLDPLPQGFLQGLCSSMPLYHFFTDFQPPLWCTHIQTHMTGRLCCAFCRLNIPTCMFLSHPKCKTPKLRCSAYGQCISQCPLESSVPLFSWSQKSQPTWRRKLSLLCWPWRPLAGWPHAPFLGVERVARTYTHYQM